MADWDDESEGEVQKKVVPIPPIPKKSKWEGEDEDENKVVDDWEESSEEEEKPAPKAVVASAPKKKGTLKAKIAEKEAERAARRAAGLDTDEDEEEEEVDDAAARRRMERERELAADMDHATELLGTASIGGSVKSTDSSPLSAANPKTKPEFEAFAKQVVESVIAKHQNKPLYSSFVEILVKELCMPLRDVEVRKSASVLTALANEKQKEQKDKASGKKKPKAAAKPTLGAAKPGKVDTRVYGEALDDDFGNDPDDFM